MGHGRRIYDIATMGLCLTAAVFLALSALGRTDPPVSARNLPEPESRPEERPPPTALPAAIRLPAPPPPETPTVTYPVAPAPEIPLTVTALRARPEVPKVNDGTLSPPIRPVTPLRPAAPQPEIAPETAPEPGRFDRRPPPAEKVQPDVTVAESAPDFAQTLRRGRALLRLLEQDSGPDLRIAWPADAPTRERLYAVLKDCFGMESVLMTDDGRLYRAAGPAGVAQAPDVARYSGFVRAVEGVMPDRERGDLYPIYRRHGLGPGQVQAVRIFPRRADAMLLGGLSALLGDGLPDGQRIEARYALDRSGVTVTDLRRDGTPVTGTVRLQPRGGCGRSA